MRVSRTARLISARLIRLIRLIRLMESIPKERIKERKTDATRAPVKEITAKEPAA